MVLHFSLLVHLIDALQWLALELFETGWGNVLESLLFRVVLSRLQERPHNGVLYRVQNSLMTIHHDLCCGFAFSCWLRFQQGNFNWSKESSERAVCHERLSVGICLGNQLRLQKQTWVVDSTSPSFAGNQEFQPPNYFFIAWLPLILLWY